MVTSPIALSWEHYTNMENLFWNSSLAMGYLTYAQGEAQAFEPGQTIDRRQAIGFELIRVEISL